MNILVSNVGSTSLKFKLYRMPAENVLCEARIENIGSDEAGYRFSNNVDRTGYEKTAAISSYKEGIDLFLNDLTGREYGVLTSVDMIDAVGFKTVIAKGCNGTVLLDEAVLKAMEEMLFIAPVHNRAYIDAITQFRQVMPLVRMVGVFETSFHQTIPLKNRIYPIPYEWYERYGIARNGYHGASFTYLAGEARKEKDYRFIIGCHLGGSSSICAIRDGKSYDSSFGFSLQTGLPHANRSGDADPYLVPFLQEQGLSWQEIDEGLSHRGGLLGISGLSNDLREIISAADQGNERATLALDAYATAIVRYIGAFYAEMGGLEKLVFTGGIGENSARIRSIVCGQHGHLGIVLDEKANEDVPSDGFISSADSKVLVQVIRADEETGIARETYRYLNEEHKS